MTTKLGQQTYQLDAPPRIIGYGSTGGSKEYEGPLGPYLDHTSPDDTFGAKCWEQSETVMQTLALTSAVERAGIAKEALDLMLAGDLLNQCTGSGFAARCAGVPYLGLYGACSTMGESLALASLLLSGGCGRYAAALTSSHFCSAERQYRTPLEYGCQRPPTAQWTATASGAVVLDGKGTHGPAVTHVTIGGVVDKGICDPANMGAAMAPAAYDTLKTHFADTGRTPEDYDLILTGDLGQLGWEILREFFASDGMPLCRYNDCGLILFDRTRQDVHSGASGCGCSAAVLTAWLLPGLNAGRWNRVLFCPTGALLSPTLTLQGESIPGICHAVVLERRGA